ncbi:MAG: RluA family pseudouridine synthase [Christensenellales bacterium]
MKEFIVKDSVGERLDVFVAKQLNQTRSSIKNLLDDDKILVNEKKQKAGYKVCLNDKIRVEEVEKQQLNATPQDIKLDVVYEDDDLIVINKPQGMVVHPAVGNYQGTLVNALTYRFKQLSNLNGSFRPGIVHRLDKDTSGLLIVAKNNKAHLALAKQISTKECKRHYMAVLQGNLKQDSGQVVTNIARSKRNRQIMEVCDSTHGKLAITNFEVVERLKGYTLVHFELKTGRTHQIRVHSKYLGHPIAGDKVYGFKDKEKELYGQLLTAYKICFEQPTTKKQIECQVDLPDYFVDFVQKHKL